MSESGGRGFIPPERLHQAARSQIDGVKGKDLLTTGEIASRISCAPMRPISLFSKRSRIRTISSMVSSECSCGEFAGAFDKLSSAFQPSRSKRFFHLKSHERDRGMHLRIWATDFPFSKSLNACCRFSIS
jgi:hypothetical protein